MDGRHTKNLSAEKKKRGGNGGGRENSCNFAFQMLTAKCNWQGRYYFHPLVLRRNLLYLSLLVACRPFSVWTGLEAVWTTGLGVLFGWGEVVSFLYQPTDFYKSSHHSYQEELSKASWSIFLFKFEF